MRGRDRRARRARAPTAWRVATTLPRAGAEPYGFGRVPRRELRRADRPSGRDGAVRARLVRRRRRAARHRGHRSTAAATSTASPATSRASASGRSTSSAARPAAALPFDRYLFQVAAVGDGYGGLEHRSSTSLLCRRDELPATGDAEDRRRLPELPRSREPRVLPQLERQADQAGRVRRRTTSRARTTRASCGRSRASRPTTTTSRCVRSGVIEPPSVPRAPRPHDHDGAAHAGPPPAERRRVELRRLDQVLPAGREHAERRRQLLREGRAGRARARPHAAPHGDRRSTP